MLSTIEYSQLQATVVASLQRGNDVLKQLHKTLNVEKVEAVMEETAEGDGRR